MPDWYRPEEYKHHLLLCVDVLLHADGGGKGRCMSDHESKRGATCGVKICFAQCMGAQTSMEVFPKREL